jgi:hypothetical protein
MTTMTNERNANSRELLQAADVETLFMHLISVLAKEHLDMYGRTIPLGDQYAITIIAETKECHFSEQGMYQTFFVDHGVELSVLDK